MFSFTALDLVAIIWFIVAWGGYSLTVERTSLRKRSLNFRMHQYREEWMREMLEIGRAHV